MFRITWRHTMLRIPQYYSETLTCKQKMVISILLLTSIVVVADWQAEGAVAVGLYGPDRYDGLSDECLLPMDFGYCRAKVKRYYFDIRRMKCSLFYWGGCAGNQNNFKSLEECNKYCSAAYEDNNYQSSPTTASTPPTLQHHRERGEREREREQSNHNQRIDSNVNRYDLTNYNYNQNYFNSNKNNNNNYNNRINAYPQRTGNIIKSNSKSNIGYKNKAYPGNYSNYNASVAGGITPSGSFGSVSSSAASYSKIYKPSAYASRASTEAKEVLEGVAEEDNDEDLNGEYDN